MENNYSLNLSWGVYVPPRVERALSRPFDALKQRVIHQLEHTADQSTIRLISEVKRILDSFNSIGVEIETFFKADELKELECPIMKTIMSTPIMCIFDKIDAIPLTISLEAFEKLPTNKNPIIPNQIIVDARLDSHRLRIIHNTLQKKAQALNLTPAPSKQVNCFFDVKAFDTLPKIRTFFDCLFFTGVLNNVQHKELTAHQDLNQSQESLLIFLGNKSKNLKTEIQEALEIYSYHIDEKNKHINATTCNAEVIKEILKIVKLISENTETNHKLELDLYRKFLSEFKYRNKLEVLLSILELQNISLDVAYRSPIPCKIKILFEKISTDASGWHKLMTALTQCMMYDLKEKKKIGTELTPTQNHWHIDQIKRTTRGMNLSIHSDASTTLGPWFNSSYIWLEIMSIFDTSQKLDILLSLLEINGLIENNTTEDCLRRKNIPECVSMIKEEMEKTHPFDKRKLFINIIIKCTRYPLIPTVEKVSRKQRPDWNFPVFNRIENQLYSKEYEKMHMQAFYSKDEELWHLLLQLFDTHKKIDIFIEELQEYSIISKLDVEMLSWNKSVPTCIIQIKRLLENKANELQIRSLQDILYPIKECLTR